MNSFDDIKKLNVDGNKIAIYRLSDGESLVQIEQDINLRRDLVERFKQEIDTLMIYDLKQDGAQCLAFEPNHGIDGGITTVCGNGLKAIASVLQEDVTPLHTKAGKFHAFKQNDETLIHCGRFISTDKISRYFFDKSLKELKSDVLNLCKNLEHLSPVVSFGCNVENDQFIGEPQLVIGTFEKLSKKKLYALSRECGTAIRNSSLFKIESNITFFSFNKMDANMCKIIACTFERHLGDDHNIAITGSCGTGAMAASNVFLKSFLLKKPKKVKFELQFPEGNVCVEIEKGKTCLRGKGEYENI